MIINRLKIKLIIIFYSIITLGFNAQCSENSEENIKNLNHFQVAIQQEEERKHDLATYNYNLALGGKKPVKILDTVTPTNVPHIDSQERKRGSGYFEDGAGKRVLNNKINTDVIIEIEDHSNDESTGELRYLLRRDSNPIDSDADELTFSLNSNAPIFAYENLDENQRKFRQAIDHYIFVREPSKKVKCFAFLTAVTGLVAVPAARCGMSLYYIGDTLNTQPDTGASNELISWLMISTALPIGHHFYKMGEDLISTILHENYLSETPEDYDFLPHSFIKSKAYYPASGASVISSFLIATREALLYKIAEHKFPLFYAGTVFPYGFSSFGRELKVAFRGINKSCRLEKKGESVKRRYMIKNLKPLKNALSKNSALIDRVYKNFICLKKDQNTSNFLHFLLREGKFATNKLVPFSSFENDVNKSAASWHDNAAYWASIFLAGASTQAEFFIGQEIFEALLLEVGIPPDQAWIAGACLSTITTVHNKFNYHHTQTQCLLDIKNLFAEFSLKELTFAGVVLGGAAYGSSYVNGSIFSLADFVIGRNQVYQNSSFGQMAASLGPLLVTKTIAHASFLIEGTIHGARELSCGFLNILPEYISGSGWIANAKKTANLNLQVEKAISYLEKADALTLKKIHEMTQDIVER